MTAIREGAVNPPVLDALAVDAACSGNPGVMDYQGVYVASRTQIFHYMAPVGTNNIGEFLAIVHGLAYLKKNGLKQVFLPNSQYPICVSRWCSCWPAAMPRRAVSAPRGRQSGA